LRGKDKTVYKLSYKKGIKLTKYQFFCKDNRRIETRFPSEREAKLRFMQTGNTTSEAAEKYYYCLSCKGWHLSNPIGKKPVKNRFYCYDSVKVRMLFKTEKKAINFIKLNSAEIEENSNVKLERHYYCIACNGWHITSRKEDSSIKSRTEKIIRQYERAKNAMMPKEERAKIQLDKVEAKIKRLEENDKIRNKEAISQTLERITSQFEHIDRISDNFAGRKKDLTSRINILGLSITGTIYIKKISDSGQVDDTLKMIEKTIKEVETSKTPVHKRFKILYYVDKNLECVIENIENTIGINKKQKKRIKEIESSIDSLKRQIQISKLEKNIDNKEDYFKQRNEIKTKIDFYFNKIESNIAYLETSKTAFDTHILAFIFDNLSALKELLNAYKKNLKCEHYYRYIAEMMSVKLQRKNDIEERLNKVVEEVKRYI
jgi:hypothetical protein